jgi:hypothetical protein
MISLFRRYRFIALLVFAFAPSIALAGGFFESITPHAFFSAGANGGDQIQGLTFKNTSPDSANVNPPSLKQKSGDWSIQSNSCLNATLGPGDACTVFVEFAPTSTGKQSATLSIQAIDLTSAHSSTATSHMQGTGT